MQQCRELRTENRDLDKRNTQSEARPPPARPATAPRRQHHEGHRPLDASNPRRVDGIHVLRLLDCAQHLDDLPDVEAVAGSPSRAFPCSYEPLSARDPRCRWRNEAAAPIASSSFAAAVRVLGRLRDGPRPALRGRALRAPPRKSWPAPFFAGNSGLFTLSRVLPGDRTCLCLPNTRPRTRPPRSPARRRPRRCRRRSSLREASAQRRSPNHGAREILTVRTYSTYLQNTAALL